MHLLQYTGENGLATFYQLLALFWPASKSERTARARLSLLEQAGLLTHHYIGARWPAELVFCLTGRAAELFEPAQRELMIIGLPSHHEQKQILMAQDTRLYLERYLPTQHLRLIQWTNERVVRGRALANRLEGGSGWLRQDESAEGPSHMAEVPDGEIILGRVNSRGELITGSQFRVYLEMDGQYWGKQLDQKLASLARLPDQTIYVVPEPRAERLRRALEPYASSGKLILLVLPWAKQVK